MSSECRSRVLAILLLAGMSGLTGCIRVDTGTSVPTLGDQLVDLAKAKEKGLLSEEEFDSLKRLLLQSLD